MESIEKVKMSNDTAMYIPKYRYTLRRRSFSEHIYIHVTKCSLSQQQLLRLTF